MMSAAAVAWPFQPATPFWPDWAAARQSDITLGRESVAPFLRSCTWSAHALFVGCCYAPFSSFLIHPLSLKAPRVKWNKCWKSWKILDRICECTNSPRSEISLRCRPKTIFATSPWWIFHFYLVQYSLNDFCEVWFLLKYMYPKYQRF